MWEWQTIVDSTPPSPRASNPFGISLFQDYLIRNPSMSAFFNHPYTYHASQLAGETSGNATLPSPHDIPTFSIDAESSFVAENAAYCHYDQHLVPQTQRIEPSSFQAISFGQPEFTFGPSNRTDHNTVMPDTSALFSSSHGLGQVSIQPQLTIAPCDIGLSDVYPSLEDRVALSSQIFWAGSTPYESGAPLQPSQSNKSQENTLINGTEGFPAMQTGNAQAFCDADQPTEVDLHIYNDATRGPDGSLLEMWDSPPELVEDNGTPDEANPDIPEDILTTSPESINNALPVRRKKSSRIHKCKLCKKEFPRPSGLATHMNIHSGKRPYACMFPGCEQRFTVRSNAKRHLKVHGVDPSKIRSNPTPYIVNFNDPIINSIDMRLGNPKRFKWIPTSLKTYGNSEQLHSEVSSEEDYEGDDGAVMAANGSPPQILSPSNNSSKGRSSTSEDEGSHPYHPIQWNANGMPGRAI